MPHEPIVFFTLKVEIVMNFMNTKNEGYQVGLLLNANLLKIRVLFRGICDKIHSVLLLWFCLAVSSRLARHRSFCLASRETKNCEKKVISTYEGIA